MQWSSNFFLYLSGWKEKRKRIKKGWRVVRGWLWKSGKIYRHPIEVCSSVLISDKSKTWSHYFIFINKCSSLSTKHYLEMIKEKKKVGTRHNVATKKQTWRKKKEIKTIFGKIILLLCAHDWITPWRLNRHVVGSSSSDCVIVCLSQKQEGSVLSLSAVGSQIQVAALKEKI